MSDLCKVLADATARLSGAGIENARADARILLAHAMGTESNELDGSLKVDAPALALFRRYVERRAAREPVAYITGIKEFWSLEFEVGPGVLVPRPETETLIEEILNAFPDRGVALDMLDLGTGSGCILIAALHEFPNARGVGVEQSPDALAWAKKNVARHEMTARCALRLSDWHDGIEGRFDAIFSNPPYVAAGDVAKLADEVKRYEPGAALTSGEDGLEAYRVLAPLIAKSLKVKGSALLELGQGQTEQVSAILTVEGLKVARMAADLAGIPRCIVATKAA